MAKRLDITPEIAATLKAATKDPNFDTSKVAVYETVLADTNPINQRGSLFDKGTLSVSLLQDMANVLNAPATVPLQTMHDSSELPTGRVFSAWLNSQTPDGSTQLEGLFYIPVDRTQLVNDIEASVIDSVSIGVRAAKLLCSECGWDYMSPESTFMNIMDRCCANDHTVGTDGVHINSVGLDSWYETSLVGSGGVPRAKIRSRAAAMTPQAYKERLAASGIPAEATVLTASFKSPGALNPKGNDKMAGDLDGLVTKLSEAVTSVANLTTVKATLEGSVATLTAANGEQAAKITELTTQLAGMTDGATVAALNTKITTLEGAAAAAATETAAILTFLKEQAKLALTASGKTVDVLPEGGSALIEMIKASGVALHQTFAGASRTQTEDENAGDVTLSSSAFKTPRR